MNQIQENSRQAIDARIKALEEFIEEPVRVFKSRLKYERNALAPISSLPPEISHNDAEIGRCTRKSPRAILSNSSGKPMWTH